MALVDAAHQDTVSWALLHPECLDKKGPPLAKGEGWRKVKTTAVLPLLSILVDFLQYCRRARLFCPTSLKSPLDIRFGVLDSLHKLVQTYLV